MIRKSEREAERAKKLRLVETKLLSVSVFEINLEREDLVARDHCNVIAERLREASNRRKALADELAELQRD